MYVDQKGNNMDPTLYPAAPFPTSSAEEVVAYNIEGQLVKNKATHSAAKLAPRPTPATGDPVSTISTTTTTMETPTQPSLAVSTSTPAPAPPVVNLPPPPIATPTTIPVATDSSDSQPAQAVTASSSSSSVTSSTSTVKLGSDQPAVGTSSPAPALNAPPSGEVKVVDTITDKSQSASVPSMNPSPASSNVTL
jgi:hypothetical protein